MKLILVKTSQSFYLNTLHSLHQTSTSSGTYQFVIGYNRIEYNTLHIIRDRLHWLPVPRRIQFKVCLLTYKAVHGLGPRYLRDELHSVAAVQARKRLRSSTRDDLVVTAASSKFGENSFFFTAPRLWNRLPLTVRRKESADSFKIALKTFLHSDAADVFDT